MKTNRLGAWLEDFLFQPLNARSVAWFRIGLATVLPWFFWSRGLRAKVTIVPDSFDWLYDNIFFSTGYGLLVVGLCGLLALGWRARLCAFTLVILLLPLDFVRGVYISRQVVLFSLLAFAFIPSGTVRFPWSPNARNRFVDAGPCWPLRLIQLQLTVLYGINAIAKSSGTYLRGEVLMDFSVSYSNFVADFSSGTLIVLGMVALPVALAAVMSTVIEYALAIGFWFRKLKWFVAVLGISFHLMLKMIVTIGKLDYASILLYSAFLLPLIARQRPHED